MRRNANFFPLACIVMLAIIAFLDSKVVARESAGSENAQSISYTTLGGALPKMVEAEKGPYLVIADIEVPSGKIVTIEPGTVILFKNFTGLHVLGRLVAEGTTSRPIVFTSEYDRDYNPASSMVPNPYDWNGLYIHNNALGTSISNCKVLFSVYGIISETKFFRIINGIFANNGKSNLVIEGQEKVVGDGPYIYELSTKDATINGVPVNILRDPAAPKRNVTRLGGLGILAGGCVLGVYSTRQWISSQETLTARSRTTQENLTQYSEADWKKAMAARDRNRLLTYAGYGVAVVGAVGFGWSFSF